MIGAGLLGIKGGQMSPIGPLEVFGEEPRDAQFSKARVDLTATTPKPSDPHCCPTGSAGCAIDRKTLKVTER